MSKGIGVFVRFSGAAIALLCSAAAFAGSPTLSATSAANHVGEYDTVCGKVASTHFAMRSRGQPTFLNLDKPYPNAPFTALIWGSDRMRFSASPETYYAGKSICVTGRIKSYRGTPEIIVKRPAQIRLR